MSAPRISSIQELVRRDLVTREELGRSRYGTSLFAFNGRNALVDAYQEALDLACYLRQKLAEEGINPAEIVDQPPPATTHTINVPPEHRAVRQHAPGECGRYCTHDDAAGTHTDVFYQ